MRRSDRRLEQVESVPDRVQRARARKKDPGSLPPPGQYGGASHDEGEQQQVADRVGEVDAGAKRTGAGRVDDAVERESSANGRRSESRYGTVQPARRGQAAELARMNRTTATYASG